MVAKSVLPVSSLGLGSVPMPGEQHLLPPRCGMRMNRVYSDLPFPVIPGEGERPEAGYQEVNGC